MLADISAYAGIGKPAIVALTDLCREVFLALPDGASVQALDHEKSAIRTNDLDPGTCVTLRPARRPDRVGDAHLALAAGNGLNDRDGSPDVLCLAPVECRLIGS
jgi:hypothetical protein